MPHDVLVEPALRLIELAVRWLDSEKFKQNSENSKGH
jgi:hypothetical protein